MPGAYFTTLVVRKLLFSEHSQKTFKRPLTRGFPASIIAEFVRVGLRHLLVHQYFGVDEEIIWDLAANKCPQLLTAVEDMLTKLPDE